jgi:tellurite resistance protein
MAKKRTARVARTTKRRTAKGFRLTLDQALIAVLIAAMDANQHVSAEEAARAHHIIWSMRRFRSRSGDAVNRLIGTVRQVIEERGETAVVEQAVRTIPARLRPAAFAVAVDVMLADARLERAERRFVGRLATALQLRKGVAADIFRAILIKNSV